MSEKIERDQSIHLPPPSAEAGQSIKPDYRPLETNDTLQQAKGMKDTEVKQHSFQADLPDISPAKHEGKRSLSDNIFFGDSSFAKVAIAYGKLISMKIKLHHKEAESELTSRDALYEGHKTKAANTQKLYQLQANEKYLEAFNQFTSMTIGISQMSSMGTNAKLATEKVEARIQAQSDRVDELKKTLPGEMIAKNKEITELKTKLAEEQNNKKLTASSDPTKIEDNIAKLQKEIATEEENYKDLQEKYKKDPEFEKYTKAKDSLEEMKIRKSTDITQELHRADETTRVQYQIAQQGVTGAISIGSGIIKTEEGRIAAANEELEGRINLIRQHNELAARKRDESAIDRDLDEKKNLESMAIERHRLNQRM
jgi:hypothetical protein